MGSIITMAALDKKRVAIDIAVVAHFSNKLKYRFILCLFVLG